MKSTFAVLLSVAWPAIRSFLLYLINGTIFEGGGDVLHIKCVFWFCLQDFCETFLFLRKIQRAAIINVRKSVT